MARPKRRSADGESACPAQAVAGPDPPMLAGKFRLGILGQALMGVQSRGLLLIGCSLSTIHVLSIIHAIRIHSIFTHVVTTRYVRTCTHTHHVAGMRGDGPQGPGTTDVT